MKAEDRSTYRVVDNVEHIKAWMAGSDWGPIEGHLVNLSARGTAISIAALESEVPNIPIGSVVALALEIPGLSRLADVLALLRHERNVAGGRVFGLEVFDWNRIQDALPRQLFALFNRRRNHRVDLPRDPPVIVSVTVDATKPQHQAHLLEISASGCAILLAVDCELEDDDELILDFGLPASTFRYSLIGRIVTNSILGQSRRCGIEFLHTHSQEFIAQQDRILEYVQSRRQELGQRDRIGGFPSARKA
jgi:hypothetical protein